jgi:hypothetical protein
MNDDNQVTPEMEAQETDPQATEQNQQVAGTDKQKQSF